MFLILKNNTLQFSSKHRECLNGFVKYFEKQWMTKITPSGFSVHLEQVRTSSTLEGFNSKLSRKLEKHGRFIAFIEIIRDEDFAQSVSLAQASAGVLNVLPQKRKRHHVQDYKIHQTTQQLDKGHISLTDFFNVIINKDNTILNNCDVEETIGEDEMSEEEDTEDNLHYSQTTELLKCIICTLDARTIILQPCKHFKICCSCYDKMEANSKKNNSPLLCPYCRQIVESTLKIFQ